MQGFDAGVSLEALGVIRSLKRLCLERLSIRSLASR